MTVDELVDRIRARGGQLRGHGARLQYRPAGVLSPVEVDWLGHHREEVLAALTQTDQPHDTKPGDPHDEDVRFVHQPLGEAGAGVPAWHCPIDRGSGHAIGFRADGSVCCETYPGSITRQARRT